MANGDESTSTARPVYVNLRSDGDTKGYVDLPTGGKVTVEEAGSDKAKPEDLVWVRVNEPQAQARAVRPIPGKHVQYRTGIGHRSQWAEPANPNELDCAGPGGQRIKDTFPVMEAQIGAFRDHYARV